MAGTAMGLDFGAVMMVGAAQGADLQLLSDVLPEFEAVLLTALIEQAPEE